ncbi:type I-F CRISPR-associated protein Csy1 [Xanthomonas fragariae]|uniref:type I-F CRISPR-associated protein Csy1 n=1 Tax=Xanthomonas fragariae TaxID=48664 RepID=UPI0022AABD75|nr:type I-F CRISPR-associated protein Csy1 [Xanthomonas fragariae]WAT15176.1 type I-F CRISPR-associated protein Csy1 [Xanthomonas fragariae]
MTEPTERTKRFRSAIADFIQARQLAKLKDGKDDAGTASKYDYATWLADAADRARHLQSATHVIKATHPSVKKSSNAYVLPSDMIQRPEIGTHNVGANFREDTAVSDAKHLDVSSLLKQVVDGHRLLDWIRLDDPDLRHALDPDPKTSDAWIAAFKGLIRKEKSYSSSTLAKQVYWLVGDQPTDDTQYHLLQPMFSSTLAHVVHANIQDARFGEANKLARQARRTKQPHDGSYRDYRNLVALKLGGTKPQNISQLNSERGGVNYLLASLPPSWTLEHPRSLLKTDSAIDRFGYSTDVRAIVRTLADFLLDDPPPNDKTRRIRQRIEQELSAQLAVFAAETQARFAPGWTRDADCTLPLYEQLWLDPERTELPVRRDPQHPQWTQDDDAFNAAYAFGDWPDQVAGRFANWVTAQLHKAGLTSVGDNEYRHWARQAIVEATWPVPVQRRASAGGQA